MLRSPGNARRVRRNPLPASTSAGPLAACPAHAQHGPGGNPAACFPERREWPDELRGPASCDRAPAGIRKEGKIERTEEGRGGKEGDSKGSTRWRPEHAKKKKYKEK